MTHTANKMNQIAIKNQVCQLIIDGFLMGQIKLNDGEHVFVRSVAKLARPVNKIESAKLAGLVARLLG